MTRPGVPRSGSRPRTQSGGVTPAAAAAATGLEAEVGTAGTVAYHEETGLVRFVSSEPGGSIEGPRVDRKAAGAVGSAEEAAHAFLDEWGAAFGTDAEGTRLEVTGLVDSTGPGRRTVRLAQEVGPGIPVFGGNLSVQVDAALNVTAAMGELLPDGSIDTDPELTADDAARVAIEAVVKSRDVDPDELHVIDPSLTVYDPRLVGAPGTPVSRLVWLVRVRGGDAAGPFDDLVLVDAATGGIALKTDVLAHGKERHICDDNNVFAGPDPNCEDVGPVARTEGSAPTGINEVDQAYDLLGRAYDFYAEQFGRDGLDDAGAPMYADVRFCDSFAPCPLRNAFYDGFLKVWAFGDEHAVDDVVGHEYTHGVTDATSGLFYIYESAAINESLSDVFGELIDLANGPDPAGDRWLIVESAPEGPWRSMSNPPAFKDPDKMTSPLYWVKTADAGGADGNSGIGNKAATLLVDGGTFNGRTVTALGATKAAAIYYEVNTALLQSGSDYGDLFLMLPQACRNLIGTLGITAANCNEVVDAVTATEMHLQPPELPRPDAPGCTAGEIRQEVLRDPIEEFAPGWQRGGTPGRCGSSPTTTRGARPTRWRRTMSGP